VDFRWADAPAQSAPEPEPISDRDAEEDGVVVFADNIGEC
jgi:hypothetical protein